MASTTTKTVASVAAAAAVIAAGVGVYEYYNTGTATTSATQSAEIDWSKYDLNLPTIVLPAIDIPAIQVVTIPTVDVPKLDDLDLNPLSMPVLEKENTVDKSIKNTATEITNATKVDTSIADAVLDETQLKQLNATVGDFTKEMTETTNMPDPAADLPEWFAFVKKQKETFVDQRGLKYDKTFVKSSEIANKWIAIYEQYKNAPAVAYVPIQERFRMITEVRTVKTYDQMSILQKNLEYYKSQGYDSVLFGFDKDDTVENALNTVKYIQKYGGMKVWFTYTGKESLYDTVFIDPDKYKQMLTALAPYCNGYLNSWRRTSVHLWEQDKAFMSYTNTILRTAVPNLPIVGELYYGNTHKYEHVGVVGFGLNNFENSSAVMIVNFGFRKIDMDYLFGTILNKYLGNTPKVGCVVGQRPYYLTTDNNGLTYQENMVIKHEIEDKFFAHGCIGTVTLSNDGKEMETNNLTSTLYSTLGTAK